ncbi:MAG: DUF29 domain-containing protein [Candidatus Binataceae bacterium]
MAQDSFAGSHAQPLYERDYYTWALEQARALKAHRVEELDWENLAEEVEDLGKSEKRQLRSRLEVLLAHLLKWRFRGSRRSRSWKLTIALQRLRIRKHLEENPGLQPSIQAVMADAYEAARLELTIHLAATGEPEPPEACPWSFRQVIDDEFWPNQ